MAYQNALQSSDFELEALRSKLDNRKDRHTQKHFYTYDLVSQIHTDGHRYAHTNKPLCFFFFLFSLSLFDFECAAFTFINGSPNSNPRH